MCAARQTVLCVAVLLIQTHSTQLPTPALLPHTQVMVRIRPHNEKELQYGECVRLGRAVVLCACSGVSSLVCNSPSHSLSHSLLLLLCAGDETSCLQLLGTRAITCSVPGREPRTFTYDNILQGEQTEVFQGVCLRHAGHSCLHVSWITHLTIQYTASHYTQWLACPWWTTACPATTAPSSHTDRRARERHTRCWARSTGPKTPLG